MGLFAVPQNEEQTKDPIAMLKCAKANIDIALNEHERGRKPARYMVGMAMDQAKEAYDLLYPEG